MKPSSFLAGLAVGLLGLAAFVFTSHSTTVAQVPPDQLHDAGWLQQELKLDTVQVEQLKALDRDYAEQVSSCCANHCGARKQLGETMFAEGRDPVKLEAMMEKMCKAQMDSDLATVRHIQGVHAILRPDQQRQYESLVTRGVCADCPHCSEHKQQGETTK